MTSAHRAGAAGRVRSQRGQALVEMAITIVMLTTISIGIVEFGRAFMVASMITQAARDGARTAALQPSSNRNGSGIILNTSAIQTQVHTQIAAVLDATTANALTVTAPQTIVSGTPMVTVRVSGTVPYIFRLWGTTFAVDRSVTFRDEGR